MKNFKKSRTLYIKVINIYNGKLITQYNFIVGNTPFYKLVELIKDNTTINLENNYDFYNDLDLKYINGITITRNTNINGNGHTINAKNLANIFCVNEGVTLTLKNMNLVNAKNCIINNGVLNLTNVKGNSVIKNYGIIVSGVTFHVISSNKTTYDSFFAVLKTVDGITIETENLIFNDDQGHTYKSFIYNNDIYVCYVPVGIFGHVTFNNVKITNLTNIHSTGSLYITEYPKRMVSTMNFVKVMKNIIDDTATKVISNAILIKKNHANEKKPILNPVVKNIKFV